MVESQPPSSPILSLENSKLLVICSWYHMEHTLILYLTALCDICYMTPSFRGGNLKSPFSSKVEWILQPSSTTHSRKLGAADDSSKAGVSLNYSEVQRVRREGGNLNCVCILHIKKFQRLETCNLIYLLAINLSNIQYICGSASALTSPISKSIHNVNHRALSTLSRSSGSSQRPA